MKRTFLLSAVTLLLGFWAFATHGWPAAGWLTFVAGLLVALADEDIKTGLLPNCLTFPLLVVGVAGAVIGGGWQGSLLGIAAGLALAGLVMGASAKLSGKPGWGGGDMKLLAALGAWVGWSGMLPTILVSSCLAVAWIYGYGAYKGKRVKKIAFGPFLAAGGWLTLLYSHVFWQVMWRLSIW